MSHRPVLESGIVISLVMSLLGGCGGASPTPIVIAPVATSTPVLPIPTAAPPIATPIATDVPPTAATALATTDLTTTVEQIATLETVLATENPSDQPFLMKIDRISVIVGRGTLLEGRVVHGTLQGNSDVEILGPQNKVLSTSVLAVFISSIMREQVTVGDYAGILVGGVDATMLSPGMVLSGAGAFESYEEALQELQ